MQKLILPVVKWGAALAAIALAVLFINKVLL